MEELDTVLTKIKNRKAAGLEKIPLEVWKTRKFDNILLRLCNTMYKQNTTENLMKDCIPYFPKRGNLRINKNCRGITLTAIAAMVYNAMLLTYI